MPARKTGEEMNFTSVECLLYVLNHMPSDRLGEYFSESYKGIHLRGSFPKPPAGPKRHKASHSPPWLLSHSSTSPFSISLSARNENRSTDRARRLVFFKLRLFLDTRS
ncbi:unnamed protein product [Brassica napus]|nr:unnamed protein product [Brassica napus]